MTYTQQKSLDFCVTYIYKSGYQQPLYPYKGKNIKLVSYISLVSVTLSDSYFTISYLLKYQSKCPISAGSLNFFQGTTGTQNRSDRSNERNSSSQDQRKTRREVYSQFMMSIFMKGGYLSIMSVDTSDHKHSPFTNKPVKSVTKACSSYTQVQCPINQQLCLATVIQLYGVCQSVKTRPQQYPDQLTAYTHWLPTADCLPARYVVQCSSNRLFVCRAPGQSSLTQLAYSCCKPLVYSM